MLIDDFERAKAKPSKDYHLSFSVQSVFRGLREDNYREEVLENELASFDVSHPLIDAIEPLRKWIEEQEYREGAEPALENFQLAYEDAQERGWQNVAVLCLQQLILIQKETSQDIGQTVEKAVEFIEQDFNADEVHLGNFHSLIDIVVQNRSDIDPQLLQRCIEECEIRREKQRRDGQYQSERTTLEKIIKLKKSLGEEISEEQELIRASYENEVSRPSQNSHKAAILKEALSRCISFIDDETKNRWKRDIRRFNKRAVESEFAEIGLDDEEANKLQQEGEENIERLKHFFKNIPIEPKSSTYALYCLLKSDGYLPSYGLAESISEEHSITNILPQVSISQDGDPIQTTESSLEDRSRLPNSYVMMVRHNNAILANTLYELIEEGEITSLDFINLLNICQNLTVDDEAFLLDLIIAVFEERYPEAFHLGIPRVEGVTSRLLENTGESVTALKEGDIEQSSLGGLFDKVEKSTSTDFGMYLKARYTEKSALNLRNRVSHGQVRYVECQFGNAAITLFDIFRIMVNISETEYTMVFGLPIRTISKTRSEKTSD